MVGELNDSETPVSETYIKDLINESSSHASKTSEVFLGTFVEYQDENGNLVLKPYSLEIIEQLERKSNDTGEVSTQCIACVGDFTYTTYAVYDQGIIKSWAWRSNPYFIISIAKGATYKKSTKVKTTVTASFSGSLPNLGGVKSKFGINSSNSKSFKETITLSGPSGNYSSRDFYYRKGRHNHRIKTVETKRRKPGTVISTKTHYGTVGVPAIDFYSVDR